MTHWPPAGPAQPPAWTPYPGAPPPALPWYRTTRAIVLGALLCLVVGGLAGALVAFGGLAAAGVSGAFDPDVTTYGAGGDLAAFALGAGQCATVALGDADPGGYPEGSGIPCDGPHAIEHYGSADAPTVDTDGGRFARRDLAAFADSACNLAFEPYVGHGSNTSDYDYRPIMPSEDAWAAGLRTVHCVLWRPDGEPDSGTARASGR